MIETNLPNQSNDAYIELIDFDLIREQFYGDEAIFFGAHGVYVKPFPT